MKNILGGISIVQATSVEVGDLIAASFGSGLTLMGKVTGIAHWVYELTDEQKEYMKAQKLDVPIDPYEQLNGGIGFLIFGEFCGSHGQPNHAFITYTTSVAVFHG